MRFRIGRRRALPDSCPGCGQKALTSSTTFSDLLKKYYVAFYAVEGVSDLGLATWYAVCRMCASATGLGLIADELTKEDYFLKRVVEETRWRPGPGFVVPVRKNK